jgi:polar amino acid transport system permease protein
MGSPFTMVVCERARAARAGMGGLPGDEAARVSYDWQFANLLHYWPIFVRGSLLTLELTVAATLLALVIGLPVGIIREAGPAPLRWFATGYVELIRGTPALVQIVWIYYCLPILTGYQLGGTATMVVALGVHSGAYTAEIFRAGINAIDKGQFAASFALGMSYAKAMRRIILPQAVQRMIPPFVNEFANLIKLTTLGSAIAVPELPHESNNLIAAIYRPLEVYTALAGVFFVITYPTIMVARWLEGHLRAGL